ncbi:B-cell receptor CD22-like isoform X5 [Carassius auratus]|uniref:B-cell receptor CD22-like isoform X5 n=1 Tax=Carassius auratus TaxID=7957 RepID=A0A6P6NE31_CARAU|nr:B-cell receptor CD22-like isoform X5 [Carassius auratus]
MVMSVRRAPPLPLIFLLMIHEVSSADWGVNYRDSHICALKDSSVIMSCNYTYPTRYKIKKVFWTKNSVKVGKKYPDLSEDPEYSQRLQYLGDKQKTCTIRLSHVTQKDSHKYYFSLITYKSGFWKKSVKWIGDPGVSLTVTDLQVESPENVTEGQNVSLTCKSSCALTDRATFIWYRNSKPLTERRDRNNQLLLQSVRREDAGRYSCGVEEHTYISPAVQLSVTYPPKSVSLSISPSGVIVEGDSVTLICSSDSNPPAEINWFKEGSFLRSGRIYSISKISSNHSGEYKCKSSNKHGWKYSAVTLNVMNLQVESPENVTEGQNVSLTCVSSCALTDRAKFIWYRNSKPLTERRDRNNQLLLQSVRREDAGRYSCGVQGHTYISPAVQLNVTYPPNSVSVSISSSGEIVEGDSVTLSCSSDSNPPAEITWFKEGRFLGSGRIYSISNISSNHSGEYKCKSSNKHGWKYSAVTLNVMYPPKDVAMSNFSLSGEIVEGDSVTLICSSDSNPPADINWFKGRMFVGSGRNYSISKSSSNHSGEYKCKASNKHGEKYSDAVILNVMYPPKSVSVSISSSGEIVEGDSVTLSCSSDSNPPAEINWFKEGRFLGSGRIYSISNISSNHSGEYKCKSSNKHGWKYSAVTLNVMYPPKDVAVSNFSLSGEIVEGDSVTLICSSDSNPPADINWFKGRMFVGSGRNYSISKSSSNHSGEYKCKASNKHGEKYSDAVILNVMYPPKSVSVSISSSGEIVEGDSVTLSCSSDSNPPAEINWFKEGRFLGSGRIYRISNISSNHSGEYKCKSSNKHGWKYSAVTLNVMYPPKDVAVSNFSLSGEIVEGGSVTLICSSDSNPPALNFSWFKEGTFVGSGRNFRISNISSNHSGEYKCKSKNKHGEKDSDTVMLNVTYAPRNVMVSISPSGEIVEGDSVTLICSSDSNPPALNFSWFKEGTFVGSGRIYSISNISSDHSGEYKCKSKNKHGEKDSDTVMLNVTYAPRNVSVSISPPGEIVEGDSVTLSCSSDSNPPALNFSWFKEGTFVRSGRNYSISNISSNHSGEYKCKSSNKHGEKDSDTVMLNVTYAPKNIMVSTSPIVEGESVTRKHVEKYSNAVPLNVMYPPKNVTVFINGSGEIVEGDSVTLICSSDSNPPALNFSWFKENQSSSVGSGQSFSALQSGRFYCEAHNQHGSQRSDAVTVTVKEHHGSRWHEVFGITVECGVSFIIVTITIIIIMFIIKKLRSFKYEYITMTQISESSEDTYRLLELQSTTSDLYGTLTTLHPRPLEGSCTTAL